MSEATSGAVLEWSRMSLRSSRLRADGDGVEPALRVGQQLGALDNAHFLGPAGRGAFQHGEDGGRGVAERIRRVGAAEARGDQERGEQIAGAVWADRQFWRAHAPGLSALDSQ